MLWFMPADAVGTTEFYHQRDGGARHYWQALRPLREIRKGLRHRPVHLAPERHHEVGDTVEPFPAPLVEFRRLAVARCQRIDFVVTAGEAQREPFLPLAAVFGHPMRRRTVVWRIFVRYP